MKSPVLDSNLENPTIFDYTWIITALDQMKRRIGISLLLGLSITLALTFLSALAVRLFPYRDLPMMPKPFFLFALSPGLIAGECFAHGWTSESAFFLTNTMAYALAAFCIIGVIHGARR